MFDAVGYVPLVGEWREREPGRGFVLLRFKTGRVVAYLGPSWIVGLLVQGRLSAGRIYNRHLRRRCAALRVA